MPGSRVAFKLNGQATLPPDPPANPIQAPPGGAETIRHFVQSEARKTLAAPPAPSGPALSPTEAAVQQGL